jgi:hypothetical protein
LFHAGAGIALADEYVRAGLDKALARRGFSGVGLGQAGQLLGSSDFKVDK